MTDISRRDLAKGAGALLGAAAFARALAPLTTWADDLSVDQFLQRHYKELNRDDMEIILRRIEAQTLSERDVAVHVEDVRPTPGVQFAYALNLTVCIGCRRCAKACHEENNHDRARTTPTSACWR
jgi:NAD-dependent dihydropyrimidine dehydrogenase PreA subunit